MQRGPMENFSSFQSGAMTNPAELVGNGRLKILLSRVRWPLSVKTEAQSVVP